MAIGSCSAAGGGTVMGGDTESDREGDAALVVLGFGLRRVVLCDLCNTGDDPLSFFSTISSSLSALTFIESLPSSLSVAHLRILQPSPSLKPISSLSRNANNSSKAS